MIIQLRMKQTGVRSLLAKISRVPKAIDRAMYKMAQQGVKSIKHQIMLKQHIHTGNLIRKTQARRLSSKRSVVFIPKYGYQLGTMNPHYVSVKRSRTKLQNWILAKYSHGAFIRSGKSRIKYTNQHRPKGVLYVMPSDYLIKALIDARAKTRTILRIELNKVMK